MAETLLEFKTAVTDADGRVYLARACGRPMEDGRWEGWIEFAPAGAGEALRSPRESVQPNRTDLEYWATGLTPVYLEGALVRARDAERPRPLPIEPLPPAFAGPAPPVVASAPPAPAAIIAPTTAVLDPFSVYLKGEDLLRQELAALRAWHLRNIVRAYGLGTDASAATEAEIEALEAPALIERIVAGVRRRFAEAAEAETEPASAGAATTPLY